VSLEFDVYEQSNAWLSIVDYLSNIFDDSTNTRNTDVTFRDSWNVSSIPKLLVMVEEGPTDDRSSAIGNLVGGSYYTNGSLKFNLSVWSNLMEYDETQEKLAHVDVHKLKDRVTNSFKSAPHGNFINMPFLEFVDVDGVYKATGTATGRTLTVKPNGEWAKVYDSDRNFIHFSRFYVAEWYVPFG